MQSYACTKRPQRVPGKVQHFAGRINAVERPTQLGLGEDFQFQSTPRTQDEHVSLRQQALRQQNASHPLHVGETGRESWRAHDVSCHGGGIGEVGQKGVQGAVSIRAMGDMDRDRHGTDTVQTRV